MSPACIADPTAVCNPTLQQHLKQERLSSGTNPCVEVKFTDPGTTSTDPGHPVQVKVIAPVRFLQMPFVVLPGIYLSATATMRLEQAPTRYNAGTGGTTC